MKKCILMTVVCLSTILLFTIFLQAEEQSEDLSQPIETGFMFLNGEYIEAPYTLEVKDMAVYINGLQLTKKPEWPQKDWRVFEDPGFPEGLHKDMGIAALDTVRGENGVPFNGLKISYYYNTLPINEAREKIVEYYKSLPYLKKVDDSEEFVLKVEDYFGNERLLCIANWGQKNPPPTKAELEISAENVKKYYSKLLDGGWFIFDLCMRFGYMRGIEIVPEMIEILTNSSYNYDEKYNKLRDIGIKANEDLLIKNFKENKQLNQRLEKLKREIIDKYGTDILQDEDGSSAIESPKQVGKGAAYSPDGRKIITYYANAWETDYPDDINLLTGEMSAEQPDAYYTVLNYYDDTEGDNNIGFCTYDNFLNCENADILSIHSHGLEGEFVAAFYQDLSQAQNWPGSPEFIRIIQVPKFTWYSGGNLVNPYCVLVSKEWVADKWNYDLTQSNSIVFVDACYSNAKEYGNSFLTLCGGAVGLGYPEIVNYPNNIDNTESFLKNMNGTGPYVGQYRKAGEAYEHVWVLNDYWEIESNSGNYDITLCPATEEFYPQDNDFVDESGTGYFEVDTYCTDNILANEALTFETTGDVSVNNVQWVGTDQVNRVEYDWSADSDFLVDVTVHHEEFQSWGAPADGCHYLDYDREAPADRDGEYHFSHEHNGDFGTATSISIPHNADYSILFEDDVDYYEMNFNEGSTYIMYTELINDSDLDPAFYLFNSNYEEEEYDDDSGEGLQPYITIEIDEDGLYYLRVAYCHNDMKGAKSDPTGDYKLIVKEQILAPPELTSPPNLYVVDQSAITFHWDEVFGATQYNIQIAYDSDFNSFFLENYVVCENSAYITDFPGQGTPFYWHVKAGNQSQWGDEYSYYLMFYNGEMEPPDTPNPISPYENSEQTGTKITFRWECSPGAEEYDLEIAYDENFNQLFPNGDPITTCNNYISVDGFPNGDISTEFCWRVMARNDAGQSDYSDTYHFLNIDKKITLEVPSVYPTIQAAIDAAQDGNTVLVGPGTYYENIDFYGKDIIVESSDGPSSTIIDGNDNGHVVTSTDFPVSKNRLLSGFTITNGEAEFGGGIYLSNTYMSLENVIITSNVAACEDNTQGTGYGGGIYASDSRVKLKNVVINDNFSKGHYVETKGYYADGCGGGIYIDGGSLVCANVEIKENQCQFSGSVGGGIYATGLAELDLEETDIFNNVVKWYGGGICMENCAQFNYIKYSTIRNNVVPGDDSYSGAGIYFSGSSSCLEITNSSFYGNNATGGTANEGGAIYCSSCGLMEISNCIFWTNFPDEISDDSGNLNVVYSDVKYGYAGAGNIAEDPLWVGPGEGDLSLQEESPCIDAGNPSSPADPDGTTADMGAYYYPQGFISGVITLSGGSGNVEDVTIEMDGRIVNPNSDGYYSIPAGEGTWDVTASLCSYSSVTENDIEVILGSTTVINFTLTHTGYIIVDINGSGHFTTIQEGIEAAYEGETVVVLNGTYSGDGNTNLNWEDKHITVQGGNGNNPENFIINCSDSGSNRRGFYLTDSDINNSDRIRGFTIRNASLERGTGAGIYCRNGASPIIENCIIEDCFIDSREGTHTKCGAGIYCEGSTIIKNCTITNNEGWSIQGGAGIGCRGNVLIEECTISNNAIELIRDPETDTPDCLGAGIYIRPSSNGNPTIINNVINNNACNGGGSGHGIYAIQGDEDEIPIEISNNLIYNNPPDDSYFPTSAICISEIGNPIEICDNLIFNNQTSGSSAVDITNNGNPVGPNYLTFDNNTIIDNLGHGLQIKNGDDVILKNNVIAGNSGYGIKWINGGGDLTVAYSIINGNTSGHYDNSPTEGDNVFHVNPGLDTLCYQPIWNDTLFSPCIDTGDPDSLYNDDDGTPADMGAIPAAIAHDYFRDDYDEYSFDNVDWISFPVLNTTTTGYTEALGLLHREELIDTIAQSYEDDSLDYVLFENFSYIRFVNGLWQNTLGNFDSKQGYKFVLKEGCDSMPVQGISGTWLDPGTSIQLYAGQENWVGCFLEEPLYFEDAFESIEDEWITIRSEHWAQSRQSRIPPSRTANPGELYIITVEDDCQLIWNSSGGGGGITPFIKERTDHFKYIETVDYMAIDIDTVYSDISIVEIAVFSDDGCLGATKVYGDEYPVQILAYTSEGTKGGGTELEFRIYYEGQKSADTTSVPYITYNVDTEAFSSQPLSYERNGFARVQLNTDESSVIHKLTLLQNYPNPVRTSMTTIRFMPEQDAAHTELNIYNIRGQLVRTIDCDGIISSGTKDVYYSVSWDCRDRYGKDVKNGIYFYKLTSGEKSAVHKMLLMK